MKTTPNMITMLAWHYFDTSCWFRASLSTNCIVQLFFFLTFINLFLLITVFVFVSPDKGEGAGKEVLGLFWCLKKAILKVYQGLTHQKVEKVLLEFCFVFFLPPVRDNITYGNHKLCSQLQDSFFIWFYFHCSHICFISYTFVIP